MVGACYRSQVVSLSGGRARLGCSDWLRCGPRHTQAASQQIVARHARKSDSIDVIHLDDGTTLYSFVEVSAAPEAEPSPKAGPSEEADLAPKHVESHAPARSKPQPEYLQPRSVTPEKQESETPSVHFKARDKTAGISLGESSTDGDQGARGLDDMTVKQLMGICKERGISGYSKLRKAQLVQLLGTQA
jgi:hypothetical protein